jgi:signal transduction histidine kinase
VIIDAADTVSQEARARDVRLTLPLEPGPIVVHGDAARLQQVIWNLLSNAIKFTPPGGEVCVRVDRHEHQVIVRVRDTGVGIAPAFLPHIFEPFLQADSKPSREFGGLGLGLAIVRRLVEMHNGTVEVESAGVGCGSEFRVLLPTRA